MSSRMHRPDRVVVDKHLDAKVLGDAVGRYGRSAADFRPSVKYVGTYADDEDFADVLMLGWDYFVPVLTADVGMIEKARRFEPQMPKNESCLRGVIVLPTGKDEQVRVLRDFQAGRITAMKSRKTDVLPKNLDDVETYNIGLDLRQEHPRVVHLCDCGK